MAKYVEITKEAFRAIVPIDAKCIDVDYSHNAYRMKYHEKGCDLLVIEQSCCDTQYYIADINS